MHGVVLPIDDRPPHLWYTTIQMLTDDPRTHESYFDVPLVWVLGYANRALRHAKMKHEAARGRG